MLYSYIENPTNENEILIYFNGYNLVAKINKANFMTDKECIEFATFMVDSMNEKLVTTLKYNIMNTADFRLGITFSHYGKKELIEKKLGTKEFTIEVSEFEGTKEEFHSGSFVKILTVSEGSNLMEVLNNFIKENDLSGECFSVSTLNGIELFTDEEFNDIEF